MGTLNALTPRCWPLVGHLRKLLVAALVCLPLSSRAQDAAAGESAEQIPFFALLNLVNSEGPLSVKLGSEPVGIGEMPYGFYTGVVNWYPTVPVTLEAPGLEPAEIPLPDGAKDAALVPIFVVFDAKKPIRPGEQPVPVIEWVKVPPATSRAQNYLDVINLSARETLEAEVGGSKVALPKRKRVRVSTQAAPVVRILPEGPEISVAASEDGGASQLFALVYSKPDGTLDYVVASEPRLAR